MKKADTKVVQLLLVQSHHPCHIKACSIHNIGGKAKHHKDCKGQGPWHIAAQQSSNPNVSMCTIEEIGTKQWRKVLSVLNIEENDNNSIGSQLQYARIERTLLI